MSPAPEHPAPPVDLAALQALSTADLAALAVTEGLDLPPGLGHAELVTELIGKRLLEHGLGWSEGILEILPDGFGFLRSRHLDYEARLHDVYVSPSQIRRLNLRPGHRVAGPVRGPRRTERFFALQQVERVNGASVDDLARCVPFAARTPILPTARLLLDGPRTPPLLRAIGLLAPWGRGQRVLVASPPEQARARLLLDLAAALRHNHPDLLVSVCAIDQRPEDVGLLRQALGADPACEVLASTFDEPPARHVALVDLTLARLQREVEFGRDVVLLFDSLSALARACNVDQAPSGRLLCAGLDAGALARGKKLFAAARACGEGGSLTVVATAHRGPARLDEAILEEFLHRGNSDVVFERERAGGPGDATLDVMRTATRAEDLLLAGPAITALRRLRQELALLPEHDRLVRVMARLGGDAAERGLPPPHPPGR